MDPLDILIGAVMKHDRAAILRALRDVPDVDARPGGDASAPLHYAAQEHSVEGIRALLDAGAAVDLPDEFGNTPLHYARFDRDEPDEAIRLLLAAGADPAGAANRHPEQFVGSSVIVAYDEHGVVLGVTDDGRLSALRRPWSDTYHPSSNDDWEHVFSELPGDLMIPVTLTWMVARLPSGSAGEPVQLSAIRLFALPDPFPTAGDPDYAASGFDGLGRVERLPLATVERALWAGRIADLETLALLFAIRYELDHGI